MLLVASILVIRTGYIRCNEVRYRSLAESVLLSSTISTSGDAH